MLEPWIVGDTTADAVAGHLYDTGRGYPAATLGVARAAPAAHVPAAEAPASRAGEPLVHGAVVALDPDRAAAAFEALDCYEGDEYARVTICTVAGLRAAAYSWVAPLTGCRPVAGGRWTARDGPARDGPA